MKGRKLTREDYADPSPTRVARFFLGKLLCVQAQDGYAEGMILETEAYGGPKEEGRHGFDHRRAGRPEILIAPRRGGVAKKDWASGPGRVCAALGIEMHHNRHDLHVGEKIWVEDRGVKVPPRDVKRTPRIGVNYAGAWALKPWRFVWKIK